MSAKTLLFAASGVGARTLLRDSFNGTNGTILNGRALDVGGVSWAQANVSANNWVCTGTNKAQGPGNNSDAILYADASNATATVSGNIIVGGSGSTAAGIVGRFQDGNNFWVLYADGSGSHVSLYTRDAGTYNLRNQAAFTWANNTTYACKLVFSGNVVTGYINGMQYVTATLSNFNTATKYGLYYNALVDTASTLFSSFLVTNP